MLRKETAQGWKEGSRTGAEDYLFRPQLFLPRSLLDSFTAPPITLGAGNSSARIFLDGRHTMVRKMCNTVFLVIFGPLSIKPH